MILGITGISGSGKHTAADFFHQKGWKILDTDKIAHRFYRPYTRLWKAITKHFGEDILATKDIINRQRLGMIVFGDKTGKKLKELNSLVHPEVNRHLKNEIHYLNRKNKNTVIVGALWQELGMREYCDRIILITAEKKIALKRIKKRDSITDEIYNMRIKNQIRIPDPDFTVNNEGDFKELYKKLNTLPIPKN